MHLGKVVKSNSHCDYVVEVDDDFASSRPPNPDEFGFGSFVKLEGQGRHWAVGLVYNSQLFNPMFLNNGPRLTSEPDPMFTPDLISETRTLLGVVLIGRMQAMNGRSFGVHAIPKAVVPVNTKVATMSQDDIYAFHCSAEGRPQFSYYSHLQCCGGSFSGFLVQQVLQALTSSQLFAGADQRALEILFREVAWKNTMGAMR
ncbi:hypothetical protein ACQ4M4_24275 [Leptolyngbya sp. AN02str]|uniref:hypothetical protein n=1 Tax=Leptolyngbya sp. AN02str TaxID=3423363 RepID=UPI003D31D760